MNATDGLDAWLAGLAGKPPATSAALSRSGQAEAALLRRLVTAQQTRREQAVLSPPAASEAAHWQRVRLQLALGADADPQAGSSPARRHRLAANQSTWVWAAGVAALAVVLPWMLQVLPSAQRDTTDDDGAGVVLRGGTTAQVLPVRNADQAAAMADQIEQLLREHKQAHRRLPLTHAGWQIQAKVSPGSAAAAALARNGVAVPPGGLINLQILVRPEPPAASAPSRATP